MWEDVLIQWILMFYFGFLIQMYFVIFLVFGYQKVEVIFVVTVSNAIPNLARPSFFVDLFLYFVLFCFIIIIIIITFVRGVTHFCDPKSAYASKVKM